MNLRSVSILRLAGMLLTAGCGWVSGQTCPAINFFTTPQLSPKGSEILVVVRQADGSFTEYGLEGATPQYTVPNIQNTIAGCLPAFAPKGPKAAINFSPSGMPSQAGAIADLNGNGVPELLVAETNPGVTVYWDFNLAQAAHLLPQLTNPGGLTVADVNGDGKPDLIVLDQGAFGSANIGGVYVLLNNGDETFTQSAHYTVNAPDSVAVADLNGDGKPDMAIGQFGSGSTAESVLVFLGNGDGTFQTPTPVPTAAGVISVMITDFNRDGKPDLAVNTFANGSSRSVNPIAILLGDGKGNFQQVSNIETGGDAQTMTSGDFNGDGIPDIAAANIALQTVSVMLGKGDGTFGAPASYGVPYASTEITVSDFNGDGIADIMIGVGGPGAIGESENSELIGILLGNGDGTFRGTPTFSIGSGSPSFLLAADFSGHGNVDALVGGDSTHAFDLFAGNGDGTFQAPVATTLQSAGPAAAGDFNGDGRPDLAIATAGSVQTLLNTGGGNFQSPLASPASMLPTPLAIASADFNGDGKLDLAVTNSSESSTGQVTASNVTILLGSGTGAFTTGNTYPVGTSLSGIAAADLNGDGKPDLVIADAGMNTGSASSSVTGAVYVLLNQGGGAFKTLAGNGVSTFPVFVAAGDLNNDKKPDLVVLSSDLNLGFWAGVLLGNGDGTFQQAKLYPVDFGPSAAVIADFNGDGNPDIAIAHCCGDTQAGYLLGHGDGTFDAEALFNGGVSPTLLAVADINKDGRPDLLVAGQPASFTPLINISPKAGAAVGIANSAAAPAGSGVAAESIASAYGSDLANQTLNSTTLGTSLGGTSINVTDSAGTSRAANLFYVSPLQVNFQIPPGTANGTATVAVTSGDGTISTGTVQVNNLAPGIYTANAAGLASALAFSYAPDGSYTYQYTVKLDSAGTGFVANPISLDPQANKVYLQLYGTGLRHAATGSVTVKVGSLTLTPEFAGAQGQYAGLDQVNVLLPYSLKGSGDVTVTVTAGGTVANTVHITIQ